MNARYFEGDPEFDKMQKEIQKSIEKIRKQYSSSLNPGTILSGKKHLALIEKMGKILAQLEISPLLLHQKDEAIRCLIYEAKQVLDQQVPKSVAMSRSIEEIIKSHDKNYLSNESINVAIINNPGLSEALNKSLLDTYSTKNTENDFVWINHFHDALQLAVSAGNIEKVKTLLNKGYDPDIQDMQGNTALHLAINEGRIEVINLLLTYVDVTLPVYKDVIDSIDKKIQKIDSSNELKNSLIQVKNDIQEKQFENLISNAINFLNEAEEAVTKRDKSFLLISADIPRGDNKRSPNVKISGGRLFLNLNVPSRNNGRDSFTEIISTPNNLYDFGMVKAFRDSVDVNAHQQELQRNIESSTKWKNYWIDKIEHSGTEEDKKIVIEAYPVILKGLIYAIACQTSKPFLASLPPEQQTEKVMRGYGVRLNNYIIGPNSDLPNSLPEWLASHNKTHHSDMGQRFFHAPDKPTPNIATENLPQSKTPKQDR